MSASSLPCAPQFLTVLLQCTGDALLPNVQAHFRGFGIKFNRQSFSARNRSMSQLLRYV